MFVLNCSKTWMSYSPANQYRYKDEEDTLYKELTDACSSSPSSSSLLRSRTKMNHLMYSQPDLTSTICTVFPSQDIIHSPMPPNKNGFNYGKKIHDVYEEFRKFQLLNAETDRECCVCGEGVNFERRKRTSMCDEMKDSGDSESVCTENSESCVSPIWCIDCQENLIAVGCANGRLEIWEARTGKLKVKIKQTC